MSKEFSIGEKVQLATSPPYIKTADAMPMLRPPHVVQIGEKGTIISRNPGGYWSVRFTNGTFLIDSKYLESIPAQPDPADENIAISGEQATTTPQSE